MQLRRASVAQTPDPTDELELAYRNYSLLFPAHGGQLTSAPAGEDPAALTDGWRHGPGRTWRSVLNPTAPLEFAYRFSQPVTIERVQLHQHTEWPAREVEVLASSDGREWQRVVQGELRADAPGGPNFAHLLSAGHLVHAREVRVRILSGWRAEHWGLGEIEVFGNGARYATDDDWVHVNADLHELRPGETYHYRLARESEGTTVYGEARTFTVPGSAAPYLETARASRVRDGSGRLEARMNAMGRKTNWHFEYGPTPRYGSRTPAQYGGLQETPRSCFATLTGLTRGATVHFRLVAENESGRTEGADAVFTAR